MNNNNALKSAASRLTDNMQGSLQTLIYMIGDSHQTPTEDEILNVLIGMSSMLKWDTINLTSEIQHTITKGSHEQTSG